MEWQGPQWGSHTQGMIAWYQNNGPCCPLGQGTNHGAICSSCTPGHYGKGPPLLLDVL